MLLLFSLLAFPALHGETETSLLKWRFVSGGRIVSKAALDHHGNIYIASAERRLYALLPSGREKWHIRLDSRPSTAPVIGYTGSIYVGTEVGLFYAVAPNGVVSWTFRARTGACLAPVVSVDGTVYLPTREGVLYALNHRGGEKWRYQLRAGIAAGPSVDDRGNLYLGSTDRRLLALDRFGSKSWELLLPGIPGSAALNDEGTLFVSASSVQAVSSEGTVLWTYSIPGPLYAPVIAPDGTVIVASGKGRLFAISPEGEKLWDRWVGPLTGPAAIAKNGILLTAGETLIYLTLQGEERWRFESKKALRSPALAEDGSVYTGSDDWILYALETESGGPADSPWPLAYHDSHNTGRLTGLRDLSGPAAMILRELAFSETLQLKSLALADIEAHLTGQKFLPVHISVLEEVLGYLLAEGVTRREYENRRILHDYPQIRLQVCPLLGGLATDGALDMLVQTILQDHDPDVRTAAVRAVAQIGLDPNGDAVRAVQYRLNRGAGEIFSLAAIDTVYQLIDFRPGVVNPENYRILAQIAYGRYSRKVKQHARNALRGLSERKSGIERSRQ